MFVGSTAMRTGGTSGLVVCCRGGGLGLSSYVWYVVTIDGSDRNSKGKYSPMRWFCLLPVFVHWETWFWIAPGWRWNIYHCHWSFIKFVFQSKGLLLNGDLIHNLKGREGPLGVEMVSSASLASKYSFAWKVFQFAQLQETLEVEESAENVSNV